MLYTWDQMMEKGGPSGFDGYSNYMGDTSMKDWILCPVSKNRDSDSLQLSNFDTALERLGGETDTVRVHEFNHWAVGWYALILIEPSDIKAICEAERIREDLEDYPVLDEDDYSKREFEDACETWEFLSTRERIEYLKKDGIPCFAARYSLSRIMSDYDTTYLYDNLRTP